MCVWEKGRVEGVTLQAAQVYRLTKLLFRLTGRERIGKGGQGGGWFGWPPASPSPGWEEIMRLPLLQGGGGCGW